MKIKKSKLKKVIYEEVSRLLSELTLTPDEKEKQAMDRRKTVDARGKELSKAEGILYKIYSVNDPIPEPLDSDSRLAADYLEEILKIDPAIVDDALRNIGRAIAEKRSHLNDTKMNGLSNRFTRGATNRSRPIDLVDYPEEDIQSDFWAWVEERTGEYLGP